MKTMWMQGIKKIKSSQFFLKIFLYVVPILCVFTVLLVMSIYTNMKNYFSEVNGEKDGQILTYIMYTLDSMDTMFKDLCVNIFYSNDTRVLMYHEGDDTYEHMSIINRLDTLRHRGNPYIHSIYVYNNRKNTMYSTYRDFVIEDKDLAKVLESMRPPPILTPVVRNFHDELTGENKTILSYFMYEITDDKNMMEGGVILNIEADWLFNSLDNLNRLIENNDKIYLYSLQNSSFIEAANYDDSFTSYIKQYIEDLEFIPDSFSFDFSHNYEMFNASCQKLQSKNWVLIKVRSHLSINEYLRQIYTSLIHTVLVALLIVIFVHFLVSKKLYSPVRDILKILPSNKSQEQSDGEFARIGQAFKQYDDELNQLKIKIFGNDSIIFDNFINSLNLSDIKNHAVLALSAKQIIEKDYSDIDLNAAKLADKLSVPPSTLSRAFKHCLNSTIPEYIRDIRFENALKVMESTGCSISEIMPLVGIENESNFYRMFKKKYRMSPREYIKNKQLHNT